MGRILVDIPQKYLDELGAIARVEKRPRAEVLICDRSVLDNFAYYARLYGTAGEQAEALFGYCRAWTSTYDLLVRLPACSSPAKAVPLAWYLRRPSATPSTVIETAPPDCKESVGAVLTFRRAADTIDLKGPGGIRTVSKQIACPSETR